MIQRIEERSIGVINAAQTIADLSSAVKELIENSLDAHCTNISEFGSVNYNISFKF